MLKPSDETPPSWEEERDRIIGLGERSFKKSYYPELRSNLSRLERFRTLLDFSGELVVLFSLPDGEIVDANTPADPVFDLPAASLIDKPLALLGLTHSERIVAQLNADAERGETSLHHETLEILPRHAGAEPQQIDVDFRIASVEGTAYGILLARNAAPRLAAEARLRLAARIIERSSEGIVITDADCNIIEVNAAFERITGFTRERAIGRNPRFLSSGRQDVAFYRDMWQQINDCGVWQGEIWNRRQSGETYPEWLLISAIHDDAGRISHYVGTFADITEAKATEARIRHMAHHDFLTGLPNRFLLTDRFQQLAAAAERNNTRFALLFIDLDRFKNVNDTLGHSVGDQLLRDVASRLRSLVRGTDTISRQGGDEFIVLLSDIHTPDDAAQAARKLIQVLSEPFTLGEHHITVTPSIGVAVSPEDGDDLDSLLKHADLAMYDAKQQGRNNFQFFRREMNARSLELLLMESDLRQALKKREFELHYQPQLDFGSGEIVSLEALLRWRHPERGLVPPADFIPMAEETGLIVAIGGWVIEEACRQLASWRGNGWPALRVALNLSAAQFREKDLHVRITNALVASDLPAEAIEIEVTESILMSDAESTAATLHTLDAMGVRIAIDDFGTGYSSLAYLKRFPVDTLKVDRSFVSNIDDSDEDAVSGRADR